MRIARLLVPVFAAVVLLLPQITFAATGDFFGPIIPEECNCESTGSAADWGCVLAVIQNVMKFAVSIGVVIFILTAAYAGFLFMTSAFNPSSREKARSMLINTVVGFLIAISAWLLVDFIMKALYNPATLDGSGQRFGPWNSILAGNADDKCIDVKSPPQVTGTGPKTPTTPGGVAVTPGGPSTPNAPSGTTVGSSTTANPEITINSNVIVSQGSVAALQKILSSAGLTRATITSGRRTSADQARIMYQNLEQGIRIDYAAAGEAVIAVYDRMKSTGASATNIQAAMQQEIDKQGCSKVSRHCSSQDVIDVSPSSIGNQNLFRDALGKATSLSNYFVPGQLGEQTYHLEFK